MIFFFDIIFSGFLIKFFKLIEEVRFEIIASRKEQQEIKVKIDTLLTQNDNSHINKFSRLLPISSIENFDEIDQSLTDSEEDFISLVRILKSNKLYIINFIFLEDYILY